MSEKIKRISFISFLITSIFMLIGSLNVFAKDVPLKKLNKNSAKASKTLSYIDSYQKNYFEIIKRNDMLLQWEDNKTLKKDRKDLNKLCNKVKKQIKNKSYLKKYKDIKKRYAKCDEVTNIGMNDFAERNYNEVDNLLNEVYKEVKTKISPEDFENLVKSETKWLKEVENYGKVFNSMDYGTIGTLVYYEYQINMKEFRTLLLMMYL